MSFILWVLMLMVCLQNNMLFKQDNTLLSLPRKTLIATNNNLILLDFLMIGIEKFVLVIQITTNGLNGLSFNFSIVIIALTQIWQDQYQNLFLLLKTVMLKIFTLLAPNQWT